MALDILIKNGTVIDGVGTPAYHADVAIKNGKIEKIGFLGEPSANTIIDATGQYVAPGFIDINNASDRHWTLFSHPNAESYLRQGVTTIVGGNCGSSLAPITTGNIIANIQKWTDIGRINVNWLTVKEFFEEVKKRKLTLNFGTLVGHATLRRSIVGDEFRELNEKELSQMKHMLVGALSDGALGFSTGLAYSHAKMATIDEVASLVSAVKPGKIYSSHLKDEESKLYESGLEVIDISKKTKVGVEISHFKAALKNNCNFIDKTFIGKSIKTISQNQGNGILETIINLLIVSEGKLIVFWPCLSEENFIKALKSPISIIASDGAAYNLDDARSGYLAHPRSFGCFPRILSR